MALRAAPELDRTLAALADPQRRRVIELLREGPRRASDIAEALDLKPPALSRHLRTLKSCALIEDTHPAFDARVRIYTLRPQSMATLKSWLADTDRLWARQLLAFKDHVQRRGK